MKPLTYKQKLDIIRLHNITPGGYSPERINPAEVWESHPKGYLTWEEIVDACTFFLNTVEQCLTVTRSRSKGGSYGLKHCAENLLGHYVSNGALLVAMHGHKEFTLHPDGINADYTCNAQWERVIRRLGAVHEGDTIQTHSLRQLAEQYNRSHKGFTPIKLTNLTYL